MAEQTSTDWKTIKDGEPCQRCGHTMFLQVIGKPDWVECEKCGMEKPLKGEMK